MTKEQLARLLVEHADPRPAREAEEGVPKGPGYYSIFLDDAANLPEPFGDLLRQRATNLIYIGIATTTLRERLLDADLRHKRPSTFFRGIGAILGFRPPRGSLLRKRNRRNYRFGAEDTEATIRWINRHILIHWLEDSSPDRDAEVFAIQLHRPILNSTHNPEPLRELAALRAECRRTATSYPDERAGG